MYVQFTTTASGRPFLHTAFCSCLYGKQWRGPPPIAKWTIPRCIVCPHVKPFDKKPHHHSSVHPLLSVWWRKSLMGICSDSLFIVFVFLVTGVIYWALYQWLIVCFPGDGWWRRQLTCIGSFYRAANGVTPSLLNVFVSLFIRPIRCGVVKWTTPLCLKWTLCPASWPAASLS